jgi:putative peptidoglycan lipid II flippase
VLGGVLGYFFSLHLPRLIGIDPRLGVAGITVASGIAGWAEFVLLRRSLNRRIGPTGLPLSYAAKLWFGALLGAALGFGLKLAVAGWHPIPLAIVVLGVYGTCYFGVGYLFGLPPARAVIDRGVKFLLQRRKGAK